MLVREEGGRQMGIEVSGKEDESPCLVLEDI